MLTKPVLGIIEKAASLTFRSSGKSVLKRSLCKTAVIGGKSSSNVGSAVHNDGQSENYSTNPKATAASSRKSKPYQDPASKENDNFTRSTDVSNGTASCTNRSWQLHTYGSWGDLQLVDSQKLPIIRTPTDVLVKVRAASVNPIDLLMTNGYGSTSINYIRSLESLSKRWTTFGNLTRLTNLANYIEFPLVLGRDFAGVVQQIGHCVDNLKVGDEVFGVVGIQEQGTHADYVLTSSSLIRKKPQNLSFVEAASIPYAALTAWSAIRITGSYYFSDLNKKKFLVLGGSGGVGTMMIQYLKNYGAYVVSTCSPDAIPLLTELGCDFAVDYRSEDFEYHLKSHAPFDCVLDLTGPKRQSDKLNTLLKPAVGQKITLSPPFLSNIDKYGLLGGFVKNANDIAWDNWKSLTNEKVCTKWGFFIPSGEALQDFANCLENEKIKPVVQEIFNFDSLPAAYQKLDDGHARGKIVINFD